MKGYYKMTQDRKNLLNAPSKTGNSSGLRRSNAPIRRPALAAKKRSLRPIKRPPPPKTK